ncbi:MAG: TauD/TfdA family dioxygenase [Phenylobacterium sp.]|uniref:TauD/TfdA dioxygenase family protein n=1 Tax=Phenylobacterium sp. TaxID=1871053 RepID=UPI001A54EE87|nr:TauD/TfdA family dioxygenase [Phenylobacterium sp.]MBL8771292.1 TauD/TfdA family dioxygenase [Phenylobacterium sp.]
MDARTPFHLEPLPATFGARVTGLRLAGLDEADFAALYEAWLEYGLLVFPGQNLSREEQVAFASRFGPLEFRLAPISNVREDGSVRLPDDDWVQVLKGNMGWHCDSTYMPVQAKGAVFTAHIVPASGGETEWADMAAAFEALSPEMRARIAPLSAYHSLRRSQARIGHDYRKSTEHGGYGADVETPPLRPLVKTHPETGRPCLMIGRHAFGIPGLADAEGEALLDELLGHACQPPRVWTHAWAPGDAVIWDNRRLMHRARPWDLSKPRVMFHSRIAGDPATESAAA